MLRILVMLIGIGAIGYAQAETMAEIHAKAIAE
jgi:hypothetical protein